jgi:hypothetical protein
MQKWSQEVLNPQAVLLDLGCCWFEGSQEQEREVGKQEEAEAVVSL